MAFKLTPPFNKFPTPIVNVDFEDEKVIGRADKRGNILINKNIIARISLDNQHYSFGNYLPANKQNGLLLSDIRGYTGKIDLHKLNLQIVSDIGIPLPLNGYDFSLCLEVEHD